MNAKITKEHIKEEGLTTPFMNSKEEFEAFLEQYRAFHLMARKAIERDEYIRGEEKEFYEYFYLDGDEICGYGEGYDYNYTNSIPQRAFYDSSYWENLIQKENDLQAEKARKTKEFEEKQAAKQEETDRETYLLLKEKFENE